MYYCQLSDIQSAVDKEVIKKASNHMQRGIKAGMTGGFAALASVALLLAGCSSTSGGSGGSTSAASPLTYMDTKTGSCAVAPNDPAGFQDAKDYLDKIAEPMTDLLTTEKLPKPIDPSTLVVYLDNGSPYSALINDNISEAVAAVGAKYQEVETGADAQSIGAALDSVVALKPNIVITFATDLTFWQDQYKKLTDAGTAVVYAGNANASDYGLNQTFGTSEASVVNASVLAAAAIVYSCGTAKNFVYYAAPEIAASEDMYKSYQAFIAKDCGSDCTTRTVDISILDTSPADKIVSDLQAHPETEFCSPSADQFQVGLADKAKLAGVTNAYCFGALGLPQNLQQIKDGTQIGDFTYNTPIQGWQALDEGFRKLQGVFKDYDLYDLTHLVAGIFTLQNIDKIDVTTGAFTTVPDFKKKYEALWNVS